MRQAKGLGPGNIKMFTSAMNQQVEWHMEMTNALSRALDQGEFLVYYQPKVELNSGSMRGMEALLRWQRPGVGLVPPDEFIPLAEATGLIVPIGEWVLREACRQTKVWRESGQPDLRVAVNLSARQLQEPKLAQKVEAVLSETGLPVNGLELEITESAVMTNFESAEALLRRLREMGIKISLDDFGTGYSSLSYLRRLPINSVKIDKSFVEDLPNNPEAVAVATAIISMTHSLNLEVIAEGVETDEQLEFLRKNHCDLIQGYIFSRPLPADQFQSLLREERRLDGPEARL
jgi:EAL domain-containing protein (putative c-di-GMP-specific phosphodiesterase class I)